MARNSAADRASFNRSAVTNGKLLPGVDGRLAIARRYRDVVRSLSCDLGGDLTTAQEAMVKNAAGLIVRLERLNAAIARGDLVNDRDCVALTNSSTRVLMALGLEKRKQSVASELSELLFFDEESR